MDIVRQPAAAGQAVETVVLNLGEVHFGGGTLARFEYDTQVVDRYAADMQAGDVFPPVDVFRDANGNYWLGDGHHRVAAAHKAELATIAANVHEGGRRDAMLFAAKCNRTHGKRRNWSDCKKVVEMLLAEPEWKERSDAWLADECKLRHEEVVRIREQLSESGKLKSPTKRLGRDGKRRPSTYRPRKPKPEEPSPQPAPELSKTTAEHAPVLNAPDAVEIVARVLPSTRNTAIVIRDRSVEVPGGFGTVVEVDRGEDRHEAVEDGIQDDHEPGIEFNLGDELVSLITRADNEIKAWPLDVQDAKRVADSLRRLAARVEERAAQDADGRGM